MANITHEARRALEDAAGYYTDDMDGLAELVADVIAEVDEIDLSEPYPEDRCHEIADGSVPIYTRDVFELVPALAGYTISDPGLMPEDADIEKMAQIMIYDILSNAAHQRLQERQGESEELAEEFEENELDDAAEYLRDHGLAATREWIGKRIAEIRRGDDPFNPDRDVHNYEVARDRLAE